MKTEKNIDELFEQKLTNFEVVPNPQIWDNIEKELDKKKRKKRIIPIWWMGAAASVAILVSIFMFVNKNTTQQPEILDDIVTIKIPENKEESVIVTTTDDDTTSNEKQIVTSKTKNNNQIVLSQPKEIKMVIADVIEHPEEATKYDNTITKKSTFIHHKEKDVEVTHPTIFSNTEIASADEMMTKKTSTNTKIEEKTTEIKQNDFKKSPQLEEEVNQSQLAELEGKTDFKKSKKQQNSNWFVQPTVGALSSKSANVGALKGTQDDNFVAYGVKLGMQLNDKWTIQSGICSQEINSQATGIKSFDIVANAVNTNDNYRDLKNNIDNGISSPTTSNDPSNPTVTKNINVEQVFSYIEVPLEVKYKVLHINKFTTDVLVGGSSYFLTKNTASVNVDGTTATSDSKNVKSVNFSTNVGVDFNYQIYKSLKVNLNPMFKKSMGTSDKNFNNYQIGVYTGLKYEF